MNRKFGQNDAKLKTIRILFYVFVFFSGIVALVGFIVFMASNYIFSGIMCLFGGVVGILLSCIIFELIVVYLNDVKFIRDELYESNKIKDEKLNK